jgi:hypothetical protein
MYILLYHCAFAARKIYTNLPKGLKNKGSDKAVLVVNKVPRHEKASEEG